MRFLALDFETVPDVAAGRRMGLAGTDHEVAQAMVARQLEKTQGKSDFLPVPLHRIVAFGATGLNLEKGLVSSEARCENDEGMLIDRVHRHWFLGRPVLVTWNGRGFDLPVLIYRAMVHKMVLDNVRRPFSAKSWEKYENRYGDYHLDLHDTLVGGGYGTLADACTALGIGIKMRGSGKDVMQWWFDGDAGRIQEYVLEDSHGTAQLALRYALVSGWITPEKYRQMLTGFVYQQPLFPQEEVSLGKEG